MFVSDAGKNTLRPQQLNINVATWIRLLKRDVPPQTSSSSTTASVQPSDNVPTTTAATTVPVATDSSELTAPVLPPKQTKPETKVPMVAPQPPPRIEEIEVRITVSGRQILVYLSVYSRNYKYEQERKLGKFFLVCLE